MLCCLILAPSLDGMFIRMDVDWCDSYLLSTKGIKVQVREQTSGSAEGTLQSANHLNRIIGAF